MKAPKILAVASAVDLDFRYGCTPAWWQLWKGHVRGRRRPDRDAVPRPAGRVAVVARRRRTRRYREGESFARRCATCWRALKGDRYLRRAEESPEETRSTGSRARRSGAG